MSEETTLAVQPEEAHTLARLYAKMSRVMGQLKRLPKNGFNTHFKYAFVTDADVLDAVREAMTAEGMALFVSMNSVHQDNKRTTADFDLTFADGESGQSMSIHWVGEAIDTQDKGIAKAATSALKYCLLKTFLIATGDDPDSDGDGPQADLAKQQAPNKAVAPKAAKTTEASQGSNGNSAIARPASPAVVKDWLTQKAEAFSHYKSPTDGQLGLMNGLLSKILGGDKERRSWLDWTWGDPSSKGMPGSQVGATLTWLKPEKDPETDEYIPHPFAVSECKMMLRQAMLDKGQVDIFDNA